MSKRGARRKCGWRQNPEQARPGPEAAQELGRGGELVSFFFAPASPGSSHARAGAGAGLWPRSRGLSEPERSERGLPDLRFPSARGLRLPSSPGWAESVRSRGNPEPHSPARGSLPASWFRGGSGRECPGCGLPRGSPQARRVWDPDAVRPAGNEARRGCAGWSPLPEQARRHPRWVRGPQIDDWYPRAEPRPGRPVVVSARSRSQAPGGAK